MFGFFEKKITKRTHRLPKTVPFIFEHYSQTKAALVSRQGGFFFRGGYNLELKVITNIHAMSLIVGSKAIDEGVNVKCASFS